MELQFPNGISQGIDNRDLNNGEIKRPGPKVTRTCSPILVTIIVNGSGNIELQERPLLAQALQLLLLVGEGPSYLSHVRPLFHTR